MGTTSAIKRLGEIALQVNDLNSMQTFYAEVVGLPLIRREEHFAFFRIADGYAGHAQVLALFDRVSEAGASSVENAYRRAPLDHFAFEITLDDYPAELERLQGLGVDVQTKTFPWFHWRSIFTTDPEGNVVEWVCYDESVV